jgi:Uncharacterized conserved protein
MSKIDYTQRNAAIDILRALTMLLMIFVNDLWRAKGEPAWLNHAERGQDFLGLADIVLPCFLFTVGMSIPFAIETRFRKGDTGVGTLKHILSRSFALLIMGVFTVNTESGIAASVGMSMPVFRILMVTAFILIWNLYPKAKNNLNKHIFTALKILGVFILIYLAFIFRDSKDAVFSAKWWGILGMIGWAYVICAIIYLLARDRVTYLAGAWIVIMLVCVLRTNTIEGNALLQLPRPNFIDEFISIFRIGNGSSAAFTSAGMLFSVVCMKYAHISQIKKAIFISLTVVTLLVLAFLSNKIWIISKLSGTPTWVLYCIAIGIGTYGVLSWLVEKGKASWFNVIKPAGTATLTCYLMPYVLYSLMSLFGIKFPDYLTNGFAGILNCIAFSFLTIGVTYLLGKVHIKLKI